MTPEALEKIKTRDYFACEDNFSKTGYIPSMLVQGEHWQKPPRFTIIIPTYKKPQLLCRAIESALDQPGQDYQLLVVDDVAGGDPPTQEMLRRIKDDRLICYVNQQNLGLFANWNRCFELAQSEWVVMLHDDDLLAADYLPWMRSALAAVPRADLMAVRTKAFSIPEQMSQQQRREVCAAAQEEKPRVVRPVCDTQLQFGPGVVWQGSCIRRRAFLELGGAQLGTRLVGDRPIGAYYGQDYCMMVRFAHRFRCYRIPYSLYRVGLGANSSGNVWEWQDSLAEQYWCSRFLMDRRWLLKRTGQLAACCAILKLAETYNSGNNYFSSRAGIDLELLRQECEIPAGLEEARLHRAQRVWERYSRLRMLMSHWRDKPLAAPEE